MMQMTIPDVVYHGTILEHYYSINNEIVIDHPDAEVNLDFGKGFYTTTNLQQAIEHARGKEYDKRKLLKYGQQLPNKHRGVIIYFELNQSLLYNVPKEAYNIFEGTTEEWAVFTVNNRLQKLPQNPFIHPYRWTYGPMADGKAISRVCKQYRQGDIGINQLINGYHDSKENNDVRGIKPYAEGYDQLVFHDKAVNYILNPVDYKFWNSI